jgi:hypothetical protein
MERPAYNALKRNLSTRTESQAIVFVSDRKQARLTSLDFANFAATDEESKRFLGLKPDSKEEQDYLRQVETKIDEENIKESL